MGQQGQSLGARGDFLADLFLQLALRFMGSSKLFSQKDLIVIFGSQFSTKFSIEKNSFTLNFLFKLKENIQYWNLL